ncbi:MAG: ribonuclease P protein component [Nocardioides sp.]|uniref:ribonuclease P protein component n=1 Tax=Nocardioides sp. TaxID=35761 RepID=UPI0039E6E5F0
MLPRANRLTSGEGFRRTIRSGVRCGAATLVVHWLPGGASDQPAVRVGLVVSRAVGNSVTRHRVQRRLRHLVADRLDRLAAPSTLVIRALPPAADADSVGLAKDLDRCLDRVAGTPALERSRA